MPYYLTSASGRDPHSVHFEPLQKRPLVEDDFHSFWADLKCRVQVDIYPVSREMLKGADVAFFWFARKHGGANCAARSAALLEQRDGGSLRPPQHFQGFRRDCDGHCRFHLPECIVLAKAFAVT